ncbi:hypothetical protein SYNPS1DRAFT_28464 [Syncephalis pseudoplumigaleata]|uniref:Uncharacterized protein n=1 Tax=Syncephalis pseudoplumigaleata TaxID=1712513 RepID=A0A4P9Z1J4_9FUNG|nr:hypothetical protein SYNPS1DRAFT_28464 [Syncephalis pseudoplumigaleata]|eukprot:RKP25812.1 hypothetical protein SYNPS1DRAFT_28464 [Syncephalis pseudoplumigaleata]
MAGAPDKLIRVWDPRSGQRVAVLAGHTELVRALLISDDGHTALSASSDSTIKLWSLVAGRCVATYNARDNESIWSLFSEDPHLRSFYAGSKDGLVTKHWLDKDDTEAMVVPILRESSGINKKDVSHEEAAYARTSLDASLTFDMDDVGTSAEETASASSSSVEKAGMTHDRLSLSSDYAFAQPLRSIPESIVYGKRGLIKYHILNDRRMVLTENTAGEVLLWDIIKPFDACLERVNPEISVPTWCSVDTRIGVSEEEGGQGDCMANDELHGHHQSLTVTLDERSCFDAEVYADELDLPPGTIPGERLEEQRVNLGKWMLRGLFSRFAEAYIKELAEDEKTLAEASSAMRNPVNKAEEAEEEDVAASKQDTDLLDIHTHSHVFSAPPSCSTSPELPPISMASPVGSPVVLPRSMPRSAGFSEEPRRPENVHHTLASNEGMAAASPTSPTTTTTTTTTASVPPPMLSANLRSYTEPVGQPLRKGYRDPYTAASATETTAMHSPNTSIRPPPPTFSIEKTSNADSNANSSSNSGGGGGFMRRLKSFSMKRPSARQQASLAIGTGKTDSRATRAGSARAASLSDKEQAQAQAQQPQPPASASSTPTEDVRSPTHTQTTTLHPDSNNNGHQQQPLSSSSSSIPRRRVPLVATTDGLSYGPDTPPLQLPDDVTVAIVEESQDACGTSDVYRGQLLDTATDCSALDAVAPNWLMDFIFQNATPPREPVRLSFVLLPYPDSGLPDLSKGAVRLTANRALRIRKVLAYILDRLELPDVGPNEAAQPRASQDNERQQQQEKEEEGEQEQPPNGTSTATTSRTSAESGRRKSSMSQQKPEAWLEVLCQDKVRNSRRGDVSVDAYARTSSI